MMTTRHWLLSAGFLMIVVLATSTVTASDIVGRSYSCGPNGSDRVIWLFVDSPGTCTSVAPFACSSQSSESHGDCALGCESWQGYAGCFSTTRDQWDPSQVPITPLGTVECSNGKVYEMTPSEGGTCTRVESNNQTTGGECRNQSGQIDAKMDCNKGCEFWTQPADCKLKD